jgi:hypothetical protein
LHDLDRVIHYLKDTMSYCIHYTGDLRIPEGYSDSNWISDDVDERLQVDICLHLVVALFLESLTSRPS